MIPTTIAESAILKLGHSAMPILSCNQGFHVGLSVYSLKKSENLSVLINKIEWSGLKLVK